MSVSPRTAIAVAKQENRFVDLVDSSDSDRTRMDSSDSDRTRMDSSDSGKKPKVKRDTNKKPVTVKRDSDKTRKTSAHESDSSDSEKPLQLKVREKSRDVFEPFRPLMRKTSGVSNMVLLRKGRQKIFIIGEHHVKSFCSQYGFRPIGQFIKSYLKDTPHPIDFMIEMDSDELISNDQIETADYTLEQEINESKRELVVLLVQALGWRVPPLKGTTRSDKPLELFENARVHWIDRTQLRVKPTLDEPQYVKGNRMLTELDAIMNGCIYDSTCRNNVDVHVNMVKELSGVGSDFHIDESPKTHDAERMWLDAILNVVRESKLFKKCQGRLLSNEDYIDVFMTAWENHIHDRFSLRSFTEVFLTDLQRFLMDIYAVSRTQKKDDKWFHNVVIYEGAWHLGNTVLLYEKMGYEVIPVTDVEFNPDCNIRHLFDISNKTKKYPGCEVPIFILALAGDETFYAQTFYEQNVYEQHLLRNKTFTDLVGRWRQERVGDFIDLTYTLRNKLKEMGLDETSTVQELCTRIVHACKDKDADHRFIRQIKLKVNALFEKANALFENAKFDKGGKRAKRTRRR